MTSAPRPKDDRSRVGALCAAALLVAATIATAEPAAGPSAAPGGVAGTVSSELTSGGVAGATLHVERTAVRGTTDASGRFRLTSVPDGTHRIVVTCDGYLPALVTGVVVAPGRDTPLAIRLQDRIRLEEQVAVAASAFEKPVELSNGAFAISYEEVRRAPGALADVGRMVQALPGLGARDDQRNDIVARGGSPAENLTRVDGVEVPNLSHFGALGTSGGPITMLNAETVSDIRFLAGGFPSQYGNRLSSVLDISLREGSRDRLQAEFDLGMAGAGLLVEGPLGAKGSWLVSARRSYIDLIAGAYGLKTVPQYANYQAKAVYDLTPASRLSLISLGGWDTVDFEFDAEDQDDPETTSGAVTGWRGVSGLSWRRLLGAAAVATVGASHALTRSEGDVFDARRGGALLQSNHSTEQETTFHGDLSLRTPGGSLKLGGSAKRFGASLDVALPMGVENPFSTVEDARMNVVDLDEDLSSWQSGGHLQLSQRLGTAMTLNLGTRFDHFAVSGDGAWSPRAALVVHLGPRLDLTGSLGRYHQSPGVLLHGANPQNRPLRPIRADHQVVGVELRPAADVRITLEAYRKRYQHYPVSSELPFVTMADAGEQYDVSFQMMPLLSEGQGRSRGLELFAQKRIGGRFWAQASYALSSTEQRAADGVWRRGTFDLPHVVSLVAGASVARRLELSGKFSFSSGRPSTPLLYPECVEQNRLILDVRRYNEERAPAYHRLDLRLDHRTAHRWGNVVFYVELDNVYDRENVRSYYWNPKRRERYLLPQISFMAMGGLNVEF